MDYIYDVFISYRRHREWTPWTREHLHGLLDAYLSQELGRPPSIFVDEEIEPGANWPDRLGGTLGRARVLLAVFTRDYFGSDWCIHELDLMHDRVRKSPNSRLIVPVVGHDGDLIPVEIGRFQPYDLKPYRNTDIQRKTPLYERFSEAIRNLAPHVATAIGSAPPFDLSWSTDCQARFDQVYNAHCGGPAVHPVTFKLKQMPYPLAPPQVVI